MTEQPQPPKEAPFFTNIRRWGLTRGDHGAVGGVVEGLGERIGMAATPARLIVIVAGLLLTGLVALGYALAWGLLPDRRGNIIIQNFGRGVTNVGALLGITVLSLIGFGGLSSGPMIDPLGWGAGPWSWGGDFSGGSIPGVVRVLGVLFALFVALLFVAGLVVLIVWLVKRSKNPTPPSPGASGWAPTPGAPGTPAASADASDSPTSAGHGRADAAAHPTDSAANERASASAGSSTAAYPGTVPPATGEIPAARGGDGHTAGAHVPQPWEPALLPGDPRLSGIAASAAPRHRGADVPPPPVPAAPYGPQGRQAPSYAHRPQMPGPGKGGYFGFLGVLFIAAAIVFNIDRMDRLAVNPVLAWGAIVTVGLGIVLIAVALTGRKLGFLGFLSVLAVLAGVPLAANAYDIRAENGQDWFWWDVEVTIGEDADVAESSASPVEPAEPGVDLTEPFTDDYSQVFIGSECWPLADSGDPESDADPQAWVGAGQSSIRIDDVADGTTLEVGDGATRLTIPAGTSLAVAQGEYAHVVWEQRDLVCDFWGQDVTDQGDWLSATNPGDPVLEIVPTGTEAAIFIQEEQS